VVQVAIIRPGPIVGQMVNPFLQRRQGRQEVTYPHPSLEPVLKRTLGVPLFQEQLLRLAMIAANFTGGEAEDLRRAMGFQAIASAHERNRGQAARRHDAQRNFIPRRRREIILSITSFALYGFPESHAASFALIAYASAYLEMPLPRRVHRRPAQQPADGILFSSDDHQRCAAAWIEDAACGCDARSEWLCTLEAAPSTRVPSTQ
jgi:DNA polymerase III alpha subunit